MGKGDERELSCLTRLVGEWYQDLINRHDLPLMPAEKKEDRRLHRANGLFYVIRLEERSFTFDECH